jgi:LysM repeat protein
LKGDTLDVIAQANGYDLQKLIDANPQFADPYLIFPTDQVCIPSGCNTGYTGPVDTPTHDDEPEIEYPEDEIVETEIVDDTLEEVREGEDPAALASSGVKTVLSVLAAFALVLAL